MTDKLKLLKDGESNITCPHCNHDFRVEWYGAKDGQKTEIDCPRCKNSITVTTRQMFIPAGKPKKGRTLGKFRYKRFELYPVIKGYNDQLDTTTCPNCHVTWEVQFITVKKKCRVTVYCPDCGYQYIYRHE